MTIRTFTAALHRFTYIDFQWPDKDYSKEPVRVDVGLGTSIFSDAEDGTLGLSAENGLSGILLDYYGEFRGGYAWVHPDLEALADKHGVTIEWRDPGSICFNQ